MSTFPSTPKPASCKIRSVSPSFVSTAQSLRQIVATRNAHRWGIELTYPPMTRAQFAPLWAFLNNQQGRAGSFDFVLPEHAALGVSSVAYPGIINVSGTVDADGTYSPRFDLNGDFAGVWSDGIIQISASDGASAISDPSPFPTGTPLYSAGSGAEGLPAKTGYTALNGQGTTPTLEYITASVPMVNGASQTGKTILTDGWIPSADGVLKAGDFIRIGDDLKTYMVTADVDADATGAATIPINVPLQAIPSDNDLIIADSQFRCALADDDIDTIVSTELHYGLTIQLLEVLY